MSEELKPCLCGHDKIDYWYEGSHDWDFNCSKCGMSVGLYVPHLGDENQEAVKKWNAWIDGRKAREQQLEQALLEAKEALEKVDKKFEQKHKDSLEKWEGSGTEAFEDSVFMDACCYSQTSKIAREALTSISDLNLGEKKKDGWECEACSKSFPFEVEWYLDEREEAKFCKDCIKELEKDGDKIKEIRGKYSHLKGTSEDFLKNREQRTTSPPISSSIDLNMKTNTYQGLLCLHGYGEADNILFLSSLEKPLAEELEWDIKKKTITVRYWITDKQCSRDEAQEAFMKRVFGMAECDFESHYSEITGYLWTDEDLKVGGHDLLAELKSHIGKWLILEIDIHQTDERPPTPQTTPLNPP